MAPLERVDICDPRHKADPYPFYARLRAERPVCRVRVPPAGQDAWLVSRYADVVAVLKDPRLVKDPLNALTPEQLRAHRQAPAFLRPLTRNMLGLDDPDHARLKRLVQKAFTPARIEAMTARTQEVADKLLDRMDRRGRIDFIQAFAMPLPVTVISEMLGVPEKDRERFARWSGTLITTPQQPLRMLLAMPEMLAFLRYLRRLVAKKRQEPAHDLVSALVKAEEAGEKLNGEELLAMIGILLSAGHETTTNLIGNGALTLLRNPAEWERLRAEPGLIDTAIEELLRYESPAETATHRYAVEDLQIAGTVVPRGALVFGAIASANRDEDEFRDAGRLDLARDPNRHLTFGRGGHFCVGAALARMEGRVAIASLLRRFPRLRLATDQDRLAWRGGLVLRGLKALPVMST